MSTRWRLSLIIFLTAISALMVDHLRTQDLFRLEMRVTTQNKGELQVAYDLGRGLVENPANVTRLKSGEKPRKYKIDLPTGRLQALQVIPWAGKGAGTFNNFRIYGPAGGVAKISNESFRPAKGVETFENTPEGVKITTGEGFSGSALEISLPIAVPLQLTFWHWAQLVLPIPVLIFIGSFLLLMRKTQRTELRQDVVHSFRFVKRLTVSGLQKSWAYVSKKWNFLRVWLPEFQERHHGLVIFVTLLLIVIVMIGRKTDAFTNPQFWAEDGNVFFMGADQKGAASIFSAYAGYLHFLPRLVAAFAAKFDPVWIPTIYNLLAVVAMVLVGLRLFSKRLILPGKPFLVLALALVPHTGEVFVNATNIQWVAALLLVSLLFMKDPVTPRQQVGDILLLCVVGLTGPFIVLLGPFFVISWWLNKSRERFVLLCVAGTMAAIQMFFMLDRDPSADMGPFQMGNYWAMICRRVLLPLFVPNDLAAMTGFAGTQIIGAFILLFFGWLTIRSAPLRTAKLILWGCLILMLAAGTLRVRIDTMALSDIYNHERYFYIPKVLLLWVLVIIACEFSWHCWLARGVLVLCLAATLQDFQSKPLVDYQWSEYADEIRRGEAVEIPINPDWKINYPGRKTSSTE